MSKLSRKYLALALITVVVVGASYAAVLITEKLACQAKERYQQEKRRALLKRAVRSATTQSESPKSP